MKFKLLIVLTLTLFVFYVDSQDCPDPKKPLKEGNICKDKCSPNYYVVPETQKLCTSNCGSAFKKFRFTTKTQPNFRCVPDCPKGTFYDVANQSNNCALQCQAKWKISPDGKECLPLNNDGKKIFAFEPLNQGFPGCPYYFYLPTRACSFSPLVFYKQKKFLRNEESGEFVDNCDKNYFLNEDKKFCVRKCKYFNLDGACTKSCPSSYPLIDEDGTCKKICELKEYTYQGKCLKKCPVFFSESPRFCSENPLDPTFSKLYLHSISNVPTSSEPNPNLNLNLNYFMNSQETGGEFKANCDAPLFKDQSNPKLWRCVSKCPFVTLTESNECSNSCPVGKFLTENRLCKPSCGEEYKYLNECIKTCPFYYEKLGNDYICSENIKEFTKKSLKLIWRQREFKDECGKDDYSLQLNVADDENSSATITINYCVAKMEDCPDFYEEQYRICSSDCVIKIHGRVINYLKQDRKCVLNCEPGYERIDGTAYCTPTDS